MGAYSDLELKYARPIANAILSDGDFRSWFLSETRLGEKVKLAIPVGEAQGRLRSPTIKNPYWFNYWCGKDSRCTCKIGTGIETDILLILAYGERKLGLHIEVKRPGEMLGNGQAESYPRRAACWADAETKPRTVLSHDDYLTVLVCGENLASDPRLSHFDKVIYHSDVRPRLKIYPEL